MMGLNGANLKIAVQKTGRLLDPSLDLLRAAGVGVEAPRGRLFTRCRDFPLEILLLRHGDIPEYVEDGVVDLGIVGLDVIQERQPRLTQLESLGFGQCSLKLAVPADSPVTSVADLEGRRIATSYPRSLSDFLAGRGVQARIIEISGSVEITPSLDVADAVCDLVSTGSTMRLHGLVPLETVMRSEAVLVAGPASLEDPRRKGLVDRLLARFQSHQQARRTKYVMLNARCGDVEGIRALLPGMRSPTIVPLADSGLVAVHAAIPEDVFWDVIERLKAAGASDILVVPVEKMVV